MSEQYYFNSTHSKLYKFIYSFFHKYFLNVNYLIYTVLSHIKDFGIYIGTTKKKWNILSRQVT